MTTGLHYVQAIDLLLDAELHNQQALRDNQVAASIAHLVAPYDIDPRSRRLAGAFRSIRTTNKDDSDAQLREVFRERFPQLKMLSAQELARFIKELEELMAKPDSSLYKERTKLSTISTIIRPLSTKWLERWKAQRTDGFDYDAALVRVEALSNQEVSGIDQFNLWAEEVFDLFLDFVVFKDDKLNRLSNVRKPSGMVSQSNERIYRKNWTDFKADFGRELVRKAEEISSGRVGTAFNRAYRPQIRSVDYGYGSLGGFNQAERYDTYIPKPAIAPLVTQSPASAEAAPSSGSFPLYQVKLESSTLGHGEASHTWTSKDILREDIAKVFAAYSKAWGPSGDTVHVTFIYDSAGKEASIRIPNKSPSEAAQSVIDLLDLAD